MDLAGHSDSLKDGVLMTILELADVLQEILADEDFEDIPVMVQSRDGGFSILREDLVVAQDITDSGGSYRAVVIG